MSARQLIDDEVSVPEAIARPIASRFADYDHAAIARAMGCEGIRVERPGELQKALTHALSCGRPPVDDVVVSDRYTFRDVTSPLAAYP